MRLNLERAIQITGGLSHTKKMPCPSWGISAKLCRSGQALRAVPNTTCSRCYGMKGHYPCPAVRTAHDNRLKGLEHPQWVDAMIYLIHMECDRHFRWFDCGDIQSDKHMSQIVAVCKNTPTIIHWLPTQERKMVRRWKDAIPINLTIRVSSIFIDVPSRSKDFPISFTASTLKHFPKEYHCRVTDGKCGQCRKCWDRNERIVGYNIK